MERILVGLGHLTWEKDERRLNRYGSVFLMTPTSSGDGDASGDGNNTVAPLNKKIKGYGQLIATIVSPRESQHVGDKNRRIFPSLPSEGETYLLGEGMADYNASFDNVTCFGVMPKDGRANDWLNPVALYACHSSIVKLEWVKKRKPRNFKTPTASESKDMTMIVYIQDGYLQYKRI